MNDAYSEAVKEAYALAPAGVAHIHTIELRHPSITSSLFMVQGFLNKELRLETGEDVIFTATAFQFTLPKTDDGGLSELNLTVDNVGSRAADFCELAMNFAAPVEIYYRPYLPSDPTTPVLNPALRLFLTNVVITDTQVSGRAAPVDFLNRKYPSEDYVRSLFPSLGTL